MAIDLNIPVPDVDSFIGTSANQYDSVRLYSSATRGGTYTLVTTITLVAGDTVYLYTDASASNTTWFKVTFYNTALALETDIATTEPFPASRDLYTRKELRQKIVRNLAGKIFTPASMAAQTVTISALIDTAADSEYYEGWHLYRPASATAADNDRRVSAYTVATGVLTHGGLAYADTTVGSEYVEIMPLDIDFEVIQEKINDGLKDTRWLYRLEIGTTAGQMQYNLPHFVEGEEFVKQVWRRYGVTAGAYVWRPVETNGFARVRGSNFSCTLDIDPSLGDNEVFALEVWRAGEPLDSETDFTAVQHSWAEAAAMVAVIEHVVTQQMIRHQQSALAGLLPIWKERLKKSSRKYGPTPGMKIQQPFRMPGLPNV